MNLFPPTSMFEFFEHTADLGLRVRAPDFDTLLVDAARALFAAICAEPDAVRPQHLVEIDLPADDPDYLLFDWLKELLFRFETDRLLFTRFEVRCDAAGLHGKAWGEPFDPERHPLEHEVKAVTYHELKVAREADGWLAEIIVDI